MNIKIMSLVVMVTGFLIISTLAYHFTRSKEEKLYNNAYRENTAISIQSILNSRQRSLSRSLEDNSAWDEMVSFVSDPDTVWANKNLVTGRQTLDLDLLQVYNPDGKLIWAVYDEASPARLKQTLTAERLKRIFQGNPTCHFFQIADAGLLELYGSIIVPSPDIARKTKTRGYLLFGKLWDQGTISDLENSSNSIISLHYLEVNGKKTLVHSIDTKSSEIAVFLKDFSGKDIARIDFISKTFFKADTRWFYLFTLIPVLLAVIVLLLFYLLIRRWITIPVRIIINSLHKQDREGLNRIGTGSPEFRSIANLVGESFENRKSLEKEVNERIKAEERILKYADELQESNISKDKFFSILAHDLKSPFHYLLGYSDLLRNEYATLSEEDRIKFIGIIHSNSQRLYNLLENLLEWSRIQTGRIDFEMEVFDLAREVKSLCETIKASATHKNISFECRISDQAIIKADRNMIRSAIHNLLTNAIKYTAETGSVSVQTSSADSHVEVKIEDSGIGMSPEEVAKLFRIDVSVSRPGTNKEPGTGLGLILTKEFLEKNKGSVFVESEPGKGSIFRVTLPLYKA
ncbi:MAG: ATP-binding protein [Bacteroidetes bacterium]|nr:ATP-binding protein [Bacteroidota bacterium]